MRIFKRFALLGAVAAALAAGPVGAAHADPFGVTPGTFTLDAATTAAGTHPDVRIDFGISRKDSQADAQFTPDEFGTVSSYGLAGSLKDLDLALPSGLVADPTVAPVCSMGRVLARSCPPEAAIGSLNAKLFFGSDNTGPGTVSYFGGPTRLFRIAPLRGEVASFGAIVVTVPVRFGIVVGPDGGYRIVSRIRSLNETIPLAASTITLWGIPADHQGPSADPNDFSGFGGPLRDANGDLAPRRAFTAMGTTCDGQAQSGSLSVASWEEKVVVGPVSATLPATTNCGDLPFDPSIAVRPSSATAGAPSGYAVDLNVPQPWTAPVGEGETPVPATAHLKDAKVVLPQGVAISPGVADGLEACTDEQFDRLSSADETCPDASRIGTVDLVTPLLEEPFKGRVYLATQQSHDPASGDMYRLFLTAESEGVKIKLRGQIKADPTTGQLTTTFLDNPQLPFSKLTLNFKDGDRAPLVNPTTCGTKTATGTLGSWAGQSREVSSSFDITDGCPTGAFAPGFTAGTLSPLAGAFSPFTMTVARTDGDQDLSRIRLDLPSGLLGALGTVPVCAEAQAAAGTCGAETRLGSTTVATGTGGRPFSLPGTVSLAGPYKGQPFSLSIAVPAKAGPLDLGLVVVRSPLVIDANKATVSAPVDDLPQIVGGVPLHYRSVNVTLDRPGFMFNATKCTPQALVGAFTSAGGAVSAPAVPYQAQGCDKLQVDPGLALRYASKSELKKGKHPAIEADLTDTFGHANLKTVEVTLPLTASLDPDNAKALCEPAAAVARNCPDASIVGTASATTTALHEPLTGPVYFVKGTRTTAAGKVAPTLPKLFLKLRGDGVDVDIHADSSVKAKRLVTTFRDIPDVPLQDFKLRLAGGRNGIIAATNDPCAAEKSTTAVFTGQNGGVTRRNLRFTAPECRPALSTATGTPSRVTVRVGGIAPGRLTLSGSQVRTASTSISSADAAQVSAATRLTAAQKRLLSQGRSVKVAVRVTFQPKKGKSVTFKRTITIKGVKRSSR